MSSQGLDRGGGVVTRHTVQHEEALGGLRPQQAVPVGRVPAPKRGGGAVLSLGLVAVTVQRAASGGRQAARGKRQEARGKRQEAVSMSHVTKSASPSKCTISGANPVAERRYLYHASRMRQ